MLMVADGHSLRVAKREDYAALGAVMFEAVRGGESPYSEAQRAAWVPTLRGDSEWDARLADQHVVLAEGRDHAILGFMSLAPGGYIDFAFIRPEMRGKGLFRRAHDAKEVRSNAQAVARLWVHASLMAEPAFAALGFTVVRRERIAMRDQHLDRCEMELPL